MNEVAPVCTNPAKGDSCITTAQSRTHFKWFPRTRDVSPWSTSVSETKKLIVPLPPPTRPTAPRAALRLINLQPRGGGVPPPPFGPGRIRTGQWAPRRGLPAAAAVLTCAVRLAVLRSCGQLPAPRPSSGLKPARATALRSKAGVRRNQPSCICCVWCALHRQVHSSHKNVTPGFPLASDL